MPVHYRQRISFYGNPGWLIATASLRPISEANWGEIPSELIADSAGTRTFGGWLREGITGMNVNDPVTQTQIYVSFPELIASDARGINLDEVFLEVKFQVDVDPGAKPLYPSDLADDWRRIGIPEDRIEDMLNWEKTVRGIS